MTLKMVPVAANMTVTRPGVSAFPAAAVAPGAARRGGQMSSADPRRKGRGARATHRRAGRPDVSCASDNVSSHTHLPRDGHGEFGERSVESASNGAEVVVAAVVGNEWAGPQCSYPSTPGGADGDFGILECGTRGIRFISTWSSIMTQEPEQEYKSSTLLRSAVQPNAKPACISCIAVPFVTYIYIHIVSSAHTMPPKKQASKPEPKVRLSKLARVVVQH